MTHQEDREQHEPAGDLLQAPERAQQCVECCYCRNATNLVVLCIAIQNREVSRQGLNARIISVTPLLRGENSPRRNSVQYLISMLRRLNREGDVATQQAKCQYSLRSLLSLFIL
jgi:hypothetical protein